MTSAVPRLPRYTEKFKLDWRYSNSNIRRYYQTVPTELGALNRQRDKRTRTIVCASANVGIRYAGLTTRAHSRNSRTVCKSAVGALSTRGFTLSKAAPTKKAPRRMTDRHPAHRLHSQCKSQRNLRRGTTGIGTASRAPRWSHHSRQPYRETDALTHLPNGPSNRVGPLAQLAAMQRAIQLSSGSPSLDDTGRSIHNMPRGPKTPSDDLDAVLWTFRVVHDRDTT